MHMGRPTRPRQPLQRGFGGVPPVQYVMRALLARAPLHALLIAIVVLWSIPTVALLVSSFREGAATSTSGWWQALTHPAEFTLDNYDAVLSQRGMGRAFLNSLIITIPATAL